MNKNNIDLIVASEHSYTCKCDKCKLWWQEIGPDEKGNYGPFDKNEIDKLNHVSIPSSRRDPYDEPFESCPYCGESCEADFVDVGIGVVQCGPYHCYKCGASEIGPEGSEGCLEIEKKIGWYQDGKISPYANAVNGEIIDHKSAKKAYELGVLSSKIGDEKS